MINAVLIALALLCLSRGSFALYFKIGEANDPGLNHTFFHPFDVVLNDLNYETIANISRADLGFEHNAKTSERPSFPIKGIVAVAPTYGRTVGSIILKYKKKCIRSFFVFSTNAPAVYLCDRTFHALGIDADHANVLVQGKPTRVLRSCCNFKEVNVIGATFFLQNKLELVVNYRTHKVQIDVAPKLTEEEEDEL